MGTDTRIEWADHTANFWEGCTQISPACDFCYAKTRAERYGTVEWNGPPRRVKAGSFVVRAAQRTAVESGVGQFVFVNSLSDIFDKNAPAEWRHDAFADISCAPNCRFLLLTKRIGNAVEMIEEAGGLPSNAWLGITVVNQEEADRDIPKLMAAKHALKIPRVFLSIEPMLGAIDLTMLLMGSGPALGPWKEAGIKTVNLRLDALKGAKSIGWSGVDWVICGGESGPDARPMHPDWARSLRNQCAVSDVPFHFKQWGEWVPAGATVTVSSDSTTQIHRGDLPEGRVHHWRDGVISIRVGKKTTGRLLDGVEHNGRPQP